MSETIEWIGKNIFQIAGIIVVPLLVWVYKNYKSRDAILSLHIQDDNVFHTKVLTEMTKISTKIDSNDEASREFRDNVKDSFESIHARIDDLYRKN